PDSAGGRGRPPPPRARPRPCRSSRGAPRDEAPPRKVSTHMRTFLCVGPPARLLSTAALFAGLGLSVGCARGPDIEATGLGLRRVVIYRNGVGYFERQGRVDAEQSSVKVRSGKGRDFLATLAAIEQGGGHVGSARRGPATRATAPAPPSPRIGAPRCG